MILLETDRLYIRKFTSDDLDAFYKMNGSEEVMRYIREPKTYEETILFLQETIAAYTGDKIQYRYAVVEKASSNVVGMFSLLTVQGTDDIHIGYAFVQDSWGKGYASEILKAGLPYAFKLTGREKLLAIVEESNMASRRVLEKNGFRVLKEFKEKGKLILHYFLSKENKLPI